MFDLNTIENNIGKQEKEVEQLEQNLSKSEARISTIETGLAQLREDVELLEEVEKNREAAEKEHEQHLENVRECITLLEECSNQIQNSFNEIKMEQSTLQDLVDIGEDVSEAEGILEERVSHLEEQHAQVVDLLKRLGAMVSDGDMVDKSLSEKSEATPLEKLNEYMCAHNYGKDDYSKYSQDPEWQALHEAAFPEYYNQKREQEEMRRSAVVEDLENNGKHVGDFYGCIAVESPNGSWNIVGGDADTYEKYLEYWNSPIGSYEEERCDEMAYIDSRKVEGVWVSGDDMEHPEYFWGMHNNTQESWEKRSENLEVIEAEMKAGKSYDDLMQREELKEGLETYYNEEHGKPISVVEVNDGEFYVFSGDGRHRLITAQKKGVTIPMKIISRVKTKERRNE